MLEDVITSVDVVAYIIEINIDISYITFSTYSQPKPPLPIDTLEDTVRSLLRHKENDDYPPMARNQFSKEAILHSCTSLPPERCLAVRSRVNTSTNEPKWIPLLDFVCEKNNENARHLNDLLGQIQRDEGIGIGFLIETTNSYHYYGTTLLTHRHWVKFIGRCLLLHPPGTGFSSRNALESVHFHRHAFSRSFVDSSARQPQGFGQCRRPAP
jgi:hypothetical protein